MVVEPVEQRIERLGFGAQTRDQIAPPLVPGPHDEEEHGGRGQRYPAALVQLVQIGDQEGQFDQDHGPGQEAREHARPEPDPAHGEVEQAGGDEHGDRDGHAIGRRQIARGAKRHHQRHAGQHQREIGGRRVDLADLGRGGLNQAHARHNAQLDRLAHQREHARDQGLRGNHRGQGGENDQRIKRPARGQRVKRVLDGGRLGQHQRALPQIVQHQGRQHQRKPGLTDRPTPEMPQIGVQRLGAGDDQKHPAQHQQRRAAFRQQEAQGIPGVERNHDAGIVADAIEAEGGECREPDQHHRAEHRTDPGGAEALQRKKGGEDDQRQRNHEGLRARRGDLEALHGAEHRDGRRDHAVAIKQSGAENPQRHQDRCRPSLAKRAPGIEQGQQRQDAAFAPVVGAQHQRLVLERDDQDQRPEDERQHAQHVGRREFDAEVWRKAFAQGIQGTGPDVPIHDTQGRERRPAGGM